MNNITITHELCAEDRARIDKLTAAVELRARQAQYIIEHSGGEPKPLDDIQEKLAAAVASVKPTDTETTETAEAPKNAQDAQETPTPTENPTEPVNEAQAEPVKATQPEEPKKPSVTLAQIQQKVVQLAAGFGGAKKGAVRDIVNAYAKKVSDLPEDKWDEIWDKLTALESEG